MIFGLRVDNHQLVDELIEEWNEIFREPLRNIISETRYYKGTKLNLSEGTYVMSIKQIFPMLLWFSIFGLGAIASAIFLYIINFLVYSACLSSSSV